jgi:hypothetical protein
VKMNDVVIECRDRHGGRRVRMSQVSWIDPCHSGVADYDDHAVQGSESLGGTVVAGGESPLCGIPVVPVNISDAHASGKVRILNERNHCCEDESEGYGPVNDHATSGAQNVT